MKKKLRIASKKNRKALRLIYRLEDNIGMQLLKIIARDMVDSAKMMHSLKQNLDELADKIKTSDKNNIQEEPTKEQKREAAENLAKSLTDAYKELFNAGNV